MKKAYIWVGIWVIVILAPILIIFSAYEPAPGPGVDIVKIGVILPFTATSTASADLSAGISANAPGIMSAESAMAFAEETRNGLELLPKRPLAAGMPPSVVFIYQDSANDEDVLLKKAEFLVKESGVSAVISGPVSANTAVALSNILNASGVPHVAVGSVPADHKFSCEKEGLAHVGIEEVAALAVFCKTYQMSYPKPDGSAPGYHAAYAFDIGNVLLRALDVIRDDVRTKNAIYKALDMKTYKGITGTIRFGSADSK